MTAPYFPCQLVGLGLIGVLSCASALAEENTPPPSAQASSKSPWGGNLSVYLWTAGLKGDVTTSSNTASADVSFIDIWDKSRRVPLGFMGRLEAHYDRFALFVDGNYMNIQLKPAEGATTGIGSELGLMDYSLAYRIFGARAADMGAYQDKKRPNVWDVYAGARTIWLGSSTGASLSFTAPLIGSRFIVDFSPRWFMLGDFNFGGFGADNVSFTGSVQGLVGYRTSLFGVPASVEAGYRAVRYNVRGNDTATNATLNGPFLGLTGYW